MKTKYNVQWHFAKQSPAPKHRTPNMQYRPALPKPYTLKHTHQCAPPVSCAHGPRGTAADAHRTQSTRAALRAGAVRSLLWLLCRSACCAAARSHAVSHAAAAWNPPAGFDAVLVACCGVAAAAAAAAAVFPVVVPALVRLSVQAQLQSGVYAETAAAVPATTACHFAAAAVVGVVVSWQSWEGA